VKAGTTSCEAPAYVRQQVKMVGYELKIWKDSELIYSSTDEEEMHQVTVQAPATQSDMIFTMSLKKNNTTYTTAWWTLSGNGRLQIRGNAEWVDVQDQEHGASANEVRVRQRANGSTVHGASSTLNISLRDESGTLATIAINQPARQAEATPDFRVLWGSNEGGSKTNFTVQVINGNVATYNSSSFYIYLYNSASQSSPTDFIEIPIGSITANDSLEVEKENVEIDYTEGYYFGFGFRYGSTSDKVKYLGCGSSGSGGTHIPGTELHAETNILFDDWWETLNG